jgi:hypothetical protein
MHEPSEYVMRTSSTSVENFISDMPTVLVTMRASRLFD